MPIISKAVHIGFDLILVSTALAGIKRNTGLTPKTDVFGKDMEHYFHKYLDAGEYMFDTSVGIMNTSGYFVRK